LSRLYWIDLNKFDTKTDKATFWEMCRELSISGYDVCFVTSYQKEKVFPQNFENLKYEMRYMYSPPVPVFFRIILILQLILMLAREMKHGDLILVQPAALIVAFVAHYRGGHVHLDFRTLPCDIISFKGELDRLIFWKYTLKLFLKKADSFSFITESLKREVEKEFQTRFDHYVIWTSAVNTEMFDLPKNAHQDHDSRIIQLFYHGHMTIQRGIVTLIQAFAKVLRQEKIDIRLDFVGDGVEMDSIKQVVKDLGLEKNIRFAGLQPYCAIPDLIGMADICISPLPDKLEWNVSSPLKVFEYLACGKPVVVTPIPAHKEVLGDLPGIVYAKNDGEDALAEAILDACHNLKTLQAKADDLRGFVLEKYTWHHQAENLKGYLKFV